MGFLPLNAALLCASIIGLTGCIAEQENRAPVSSGDKVTIQFRRDALGASMSAPPTSHNVNGAAVSFDAVVKDVRPGWILLTVDDPVAIEHGNLSKSPAWIPMSSILMIQMRN